MAEPLETLKLPAQMQAPAILKDDSTSIKLQSSLALPDEDFVALLKYRGVSGWLLFKPNEFEAGDIPKEDAPTRNGRSKSQELRLVLLRQWYNVGGKRGDEAGFQKFYEREMDRIIGTRLQELQGA